MTGTTRDPSEVAEARVRSDSVEDVEPWDERPAEEGGKESCSSATATNIATKGGETMRRGSSHDNEDFEDGDLPALNLSSVDPLLEKQRQFWSQLDAPSSTSKEESERRIRRNAQNGTACDMDDLPEDERAALRAETRDETRTDPYRPKNPELRNPNDSHLRRMRRVESDEETEDSKEYVVDEDEQGDFCGALSTMENICGDDVVQNFCAGSGTKHIEAPSKPKTNLSIANIKDDDTTNAVEEHTAIEVEYVEPEESSTAVAAAQDKPENWSPTRKNAYLAAMAKKAKDDFEKAHAKDEQSTEPRRKTTEVQERSAEDVYNGFSATEKRKFLRLINSGLTSTEAAEQVRAERELKEKTDSKSKSGSKSGKKGGLFKFWKKGSSKSKGGEFVEPAKAAVANSEVGALKLFQEEKKEEELGSRTSMNGTSGSRGAGLAENQSTFDDTSEDLAQVESLSSNDVKSGMAIADNEQPMVTNAISSSNDALAFPDKDVEGRFAKSGVNYYDAVRRDQSETDDEEMETGSSLSAPAKSRGAKLLGPILPGHKLKGFSKLDKADERGASTENSTASSQKKSSVSAAMIEDDEGDERASPRNVDGSPEDLSAPSATQKTVEAEAFGKIEEELLRPIGLSGPNASQASKANVVTPQSRPAASKTQQLAKVSNVAVVTPESDATPHKKEEGFNLQEYMDSTDLYASPDGHSVVSGMDRSVDMSMQSGGMSVFSQSSAVTQSTRKRRPGAAKTRLAKAKEAENHAAKKKGWHETIRAAAEETHRVWQPKVGWVDYEDPETPRDTEDIPVAQGSEKIHLNLKAAKHNNVVDGGDRELGEHPAQSPARISFPDKWESERQSMLPLPAEEPKHTAAKISGEVNTKSSKHLPDTADFDLSSEPTSAKQPAVKTSSNADFGSNADFDAFNDTARPEPVSTTVGKSNEQAKQKTAIIPFEDMSVEQSVAQSVEHFVGYVASTPPRARSKKSELSPRTKRPQVSQSKKSGWMESMQAATVNVVQDGKIWDPVEGWSNIDDHSLGFAASDAFDDQQQNAASAASTVAVPQDASENYTHLANLTAELPPIMEKDARRAVMQDNNESPTSDDDSEDDEVPLLSTSGSFPDEGLSSPAIHVVKEKVDEEDMNWFPQTRRSSNKKNDVPPEKVSNESYHEQSTVTARTTNTTRTHDHSAATQSSSASMQYSVSQYSVSSSISPRRGRGPVDIDTVTEDMDSDEEQPEGVLWNGVAFESESEQVTRQASDTKQALSSSSSVTSLPTKPVPKLSRNKRDTSPIRGRSSAHGANYNFNTSEAHATQTQRHDAPSKDDFDEMTDHYYQDQPYSQQSSHREENPDHADAANINHEEVLRPSSTVKARAQQFEKAQQPQGSFPSAEWKSFMGKKVREESAAAARQHEGKDELHSLQQSRSNNQHNHASREENEESVFEFSVNDGAFPTSPSTLGSPSRKNKAHSTRDQNEGTQTVELSVAGASDFSDGNQIGKPFLKRLAACAAPMTQTGQNISENMQAHLAFLRTSDETKNVSGSRFVPQYLCGRPDIITEEREDDDDDITSEKPNKDGTTESSEKRSPERPKSQPKENLKIATHGSEVKADTRSVISEDFGAKTAYLEALAMKTAVSKPRRSDGRRRSSASDAGTSTTSSSHIQKEKWRALLERKREAGVSPGKPRSSGSSDVSQAAEKYAAEQVEAMMAAMSSSRSKSTPRSWRADNADAEKNRVVENMIRDSSFHTSPRPEYPDYDVIRRRSDFDQKDKESLTGKKADSIRAAEDLAAARVEAMMKALAGPTLDDDEGEI